MKAFACRSATCKVLPSLCFSCCYQARSFMGNGEIMTQRKRISHGGSTTVGDIAFFFFFFPVAAHYCGIVCLGHSVFVPSLLLQLRSRGSDTAGHHHRRHRHSSLDLDCNLRRSLTSVCVRTKIKSLRDDRKMLTIAQKVGLLDTRKEGRSYAAVGAPLQNK